MTKKSNAHTLIELIIIVAMLAAVAFIVIPRLQFPTLYGKQADTIARKIVTDLRRTRQLAISNASTDSNGYTLKRTDSTYEIQDGNGVSIPNSTFSVDSNLFTCSGGTHFQFGPLGNLTGSDSQLTVSANANGRTFTISITPATGMIQCTEN